MRSDRIGYAYIKDAKTIAEEAGESLSKGHYHRTVRKCQEAVELAIKGLLRFVGIEYPKSHRVGAILFESSIRGEVPVAVLKYLMNLQEKGKPPSTALKKTPQKNFLPSRMPETR